MPDRVLPRLRGASPHGGEAPLRVEPRADEDLPGEVARGDHIRGGAAKPASNITREVHARKTHRYRTCLPIPCASFLSAVSKRSAAT